jgi:membrane protease YdiL (CAAX protease family)
MPRVAIGALGLTLLALALSRQPSVLQAVLLAVAVAPCAAAILGLCCDPVRERLASQLRTSLWFRAAAFAVVLVLPGPALLAHPDPAAAIPALLAWYVLPVAVLYAGTVLRSTAFSRVLGAAGAVLLWIGFDHRYTKGIFAGLPDASYTVNALWISALILVAVSSFADPPARHEWRVSRRGLAESGGLLVLLTVLIVPLGLATGFLRWAPQFPGIAGSLVGLIGIWFTIALPEELVFRGVLQEFAVSALTARVWKAAAIVVVSVAFGLTHWNNVAPEFLVHYAGFAAIAGVVYGVAYLRAGLFGAMLVHTLVDFVWELFLKR